MSNEINAVIPAANLTANLSTGPQLSANLTPTQMSASLTPGGVVVNDYRLTVSDIDGGKRLTVKRGTEVQEMDVMDGADGISPHIGENGNWWVGEVDTGVKAGGGSVDAGDIDLSRYELKEDAQTKYDELSSTKKDRDLIVTFADSTKKTATHTSQEIFAAVKAGTTVYFNNGGTNFPYLEGASSVVTFYTNYFDNNVMQADAYNIRGANVTNSHFQNSITSQDDIDSAAAAIKAELKAYIDSEYSIVGITDITIAEV